MGSVHMETLGQGRGHHDYDYTPLSDPNVVLKLVENRIKVDKGYVAKMFPEASPLASNGGVVFVENIINTYIDLDRAIAEAKMSKGQRLVLDFVMYGWSCDDIAKAKGISHQAVRTQ